MLIHIEDTPNPNVKKFLPEQSILPLGRSAEFIYAESDLLKYPAVIGSIFSLGFIERILVGHDFVAITKSSESHWVTMSPAILSILMDAFMRQQFFLNDAHDVASSSSVEPLYSEDAKEIVKEIKELIEKRIRPAVAADGGDVTFQRFEDGIVYVAMKGACSGCPSASLTLKSGIERMLCHYIPEVTEVRAVE